MVPPADLPYPSFFFRRGLEDDLAAIAERNS